MSAKGSEWKNHKYIKKVNGVYYYKEDGKVKEGKRYEGDVQSILKKLNEKSNWYSTAVGGRTKNGKSSSSSSKKSDGSSGGKKEKETKEKTSKAKKTTEETKEEKKTTTQTSESEKKENTSAADARKILIESFGVDKEELDKLSDEELKELLEEYNKKTAKHSDFLAQSGILGMKWGKRNGPPYPLSRQKRFGGTEKNKTGSSGASSSGGESGTPKKKSDLLSSIIKRNKKPVSSEKKREKILSDPKKLYKNRKKFSNEEIEKALKQFDLDRRLKEAAREKRQRGSKFINDLLDYVQAASRGKGIFDKMVKGENDKASQKLDIKKKETEIKKLEQEIRNLKKGK